MRKTTRKGWSKAECMDCGWAVESLNAQAVGAIHARKYKHLVLVDTEINSRYDGRESVHRNEGQKDG